MTEMTIYDKYAREGEAAVSAGDFREAEACWYTAMKIAEYFGERDPRLTESMEKLAEVYDKMDRRRESERLKLSIGKIKSRVTGTNLPPQGPFNNHASSFSA
ncbi:MAG: tetratricopeptide repeat protein [Candidatus Obscuribacterales bacterium]